MSVRAWQRMLLAVCALSTVSVLLALHAQLRYEGDVASDSFAWTGRPFVYRVSALNPGRTLATNGVRSGDLVDLRGLPPAVRYRWETVLPSGARLPLRVEHHGQWRTQTVHVTLHEPGSLDVWLAYAADFWLLAFAALFAWRCAGSPQARLLCLVLSVLILGWSLLPGIWASPWASLDLALGVLGYVLWAAANALLATYALLFARPPSLARKTLTACAYVVELCFAAVGIAQGVGAWTGTVDPGSPVFSSWSVLFVWQVAPTLLPLLCIVASVAAARGDERQRLSWAASSLGIFYLMFFMIGGILEITDPRVDLLWQHVINTAIFFVPLGLTYALLSRRLLDIAFVVNRAAVFTAVSIVIVGIFVLVEWAVQEWARTAGPAANIAVSAVLALGLGLSVRVIHARIEHVLDNVFFRKRHEDQRAIRNFAREAAYISDTQTLLQRTHETLEEHADASFATIALDDGAGKYGSVGENDPAIVALRAWHDVLDVHTVKTALQGEYAYPMVARGRLIGVLVLGAKRSGEAYAPDESEGITQLALGVGAALDVLSAEKEDAIAALVEAVRALPDAIADRLSRTRSLPAD